MSNKEFWKNMGLLAEPRKKDWRCSACQRDFTFKHNAALHLSQSAKCKAKQGYVFNAIDNMDGFKDEFFDVHWKPLRAKAAQKIKVELNQEAEVVNLEHDEKAVNAVMEPSKSSKVGMRAYPPALILRISKETKKLHSDGMSQRQACATIISKYPTAMLKYASVDRWAFRSNAAKLNELNNLVLQHSGKIRLPSHVQHMSESRIDRFDLESEVYLAYRHRKDVQKKHINFKFFERLFNDIWSREMLPVPSRGKIHGFLKCREITMQAVRDSKCKTAEQRIDQIRDQFVRLDEFQRSGVEDPVYGRCGPSNM